MAKWMLIAQDHRIGAVIRALDWLGGESARQVIKKLGQMLTADEWSELRSIRSNQLPPWMKSMIETACQVKPYLHFAQQLMNLYQFGFADAIVLDSPSDELSAQFLIKSIQPLAEQEGVLVFYYKFSDPREKSKSIYDHFQSRMLVFMDNASIQMPNDIYSMVSIMECLTERSDQTVLLLLDDVEHLAKESQTHLVGSLRTALDIYKDQVKSLFVSTDKKALQHLFAEYSQPFFQFGSRVHFPEDMG